MSTIEDEAGVRLAGRIAAERRARNWSLAELSDRSGVSKAMLSKVERCEASPTATVLGRIAAALELTLAELVSASVDDGPGRLRSADQSTWTDPATGYLRRQVFLSARLPLEMVEVFLPAGAAVAFPAASYILVRQVLWVLDGSVTVVEGERSTELAVGDRLEFGPPSDRTYRNDQDRPCRYLMVLIRR